MNSNLGKELMDEANATNDDTKWAIGAIHQVTVVIETLEKRITALEEVVYEQHHDHGRA